MEQPGGAKIVMVLTGGRGRVSQVLSEVKSVSLHYSEKEVTFSFGCRKLGLDFKCAYILNLLRKH